MLETCCFKLRSVQSGVSALIRSSIALRPTGVPSFCMSSLSIAHSVRVSRMSVSPAVTVRMSVSSVRPQAEITPDFAECDCLSATAILASSSLMSKGLVT